MISGGTRIAFKGKMPGSGHFISSVGKRAEAGQAHRPRK
jgi:hypothetical protein